jgi:hypothetical protein
VSGGQEGIDVSAMNRVAAHFLDGRVLKGTTQDFSPNRPSFHIFPPDGGSSIQVRCSELKAAFFVKQLDGDPERADPRGFIAGPAETLHGKKIAVRFADGELICGYSLSYSPRREGFFMFPADSGSNNLRIFVVVSPDADVREGTAAEELAQRILDSKAA